jgi:hypothetical protein
LINIELPNLGLHSGPVLGTIATGTCRPLKAVKAWKVGGLSQLSQLLHQLGPLGSSNLASFPIGDHRRLAGFAMPLTWDHVLVVIIVSLNEEIAPFNLCFGSLRVALSLLDEDRLAVNGLS